MNTKKTFFALTMLFCATPVLAQKGTVAPGVKVYVAPMDGNLNSFICAEMMKRKLPIIVVTDEAASDYTLSGQVQVSGTRAKGGPFVWNATHENNEFGGSLSLVSNKTHTIVWGWDSDNGKVKQIAERIVKQMKHDLFPKS